MKSLFCLSAEQVFEEKKMGDVRAFVNAIFNYESNKSSGNNTEDEQNFPSGEILQEVCQVLLNVSCMPEEGRFPSFRVCFLEPDSDLLGAYIYSYTLLFENPIDFTTRNLNKLAPALNAGMSYLMLDTKSMPFKMIGIIAAYTTWEKIITGEMTSGTRMPRVPNIFVDGPGVLRACLGEAPIVNYSAGHCFFFRTNAFTDTYIAEALKDGSNVSDRERLQLLYRVLWRVSNYRHGAAVLIVPNLESCEKYIDIKYPMEGNLLFNDDVLDVHGKMREKEISTYADLISKLTSVDGSVVLTKDLELLGFGVETLVDRMKGRQPSMCFIGDDDEEEVFKSFKDQGMRHRTAYRFVGAVDGSVAFVVSQDGTIEACTKHDGKVYVYDNVTLPLM